ncbi:virulence protein [Bacillota bacterium Lsc_1132]
MGIRFNVTGPRRKELVNAVSEIADYPAIYKGAPTFAYEISGFIVDKEGTLSFDNTMDSKQVERILDGLAERGFKCETSDNLTIEMPLEGFTDTALENLDRLVASKAALIKKAIGADALPIERTETTLKFPWFKFDTNGETVAAYTQFISALCAAAKEQKRVTAKEKPVENEKFAFRVFLIRLGFVGDEYKAARKVLLKNLSGNSAFKNGMPLKAEVTADE